MVALGLFLSAFVTSSAMAGSYTIGIIGGSGTVDTSGSETEGNTTGSDQERTETTIQEAIIYGSIFAEHTWGEMYGLTLGVSYTPMESEIGTKARIDTASDANDPGSSDAGTYTAKAEISSHATVYIEPTYMPTENFGFYLKGGLSRVVVDSLESITLGEDSNAYGDATVTGSMFGLGLKAQHDSGLMFKLEYTKTIYETVNLTSASGSKSTISADPEVQAVRLALGYKF